MSRGGAQPKPPPRWLKAEIVEGLQRLLVLRLPGSPAADVLPGTVDVWIDAIAHGKQWNHEDAVRIQRAFRSMARNCVNWPSPAVFREHLPARELTQPALPEPDVTPEEARENIAKLREMLRGVWQPVQKEHVADDSL